METFLIGMIVLLVLAFGALAYLSVKSQFTLGELGGLIALLETKPLLWAGRDPEAWVSGTSRLEMMSNSDLICWYERRGSVRVGETLEVIRCSAHAYEGSILVHFLDGRLEHCWYEGQPPNRDVLLRQYSQAEKDVLYHLLEQVRQVSSGTQ